MMSESNGHRARPGGDPPAADSGAYGSAWSVGRVLAAMAFLGICGLWIFAFSPFAPSTPPDRLDDQSFPLAAEPICAAAMADLDRFPTAAEAADLEERAAQIEESTVVLSSMLEQLRAVAPDPASGGEPEIISRWLDDWQIYIEDRLEYAAEFRAGLDQPFAVTERQGDQVTDPIDGFANANKMFSCVTPLDV